MDCGEADELCTVVEKEIHIEDQEDIAEEARKPRVFKRPDAPTKSWRSTYQPIFHIAAGVQPALEVVGSAGDMPQPAATERNSESLSLSITASCLQRRWSRTRA